MKSEPTPKQQKKKAEPVEQQIDPLQILELVKQEPMGQLLVRNAVQQIMIQSLRDAVDQLQNALVEKQGSDDDDEEDSAGSPASDR